MALKSGSARQLHSGRARQSLKIRAVATPYPPSQGRPSQPFEAPSASPRPQTQQVRTVHQSAKSKIFLDNDGKEIKPMPADYGFRSGAGRLYEEHYGEVPKSMWELATQSAHAELAQVRSSYRYNQIKSTPASPLDPLKLSAALGSGVARAMSALDQRLESMGVLPKLAPPQQLSDSQIAEFDKIQQKLQSLKLDNAAVAQWEEKRIEHNGDMAETTPIVKASFLALCWVLDVMYEGRPIQKFWALETVARIPYFAAMGVLHLYESLGFWRAGAELRKVHFAEEWNELHHLQIMESLGGDQAFIDRFLAEHSAVFYYWLLLIFYLVSPKQAYNFMQRVEHHASDTYSVFLESNKEILATIPPPAVAVHYYRSKDLYLFDDFQAAQDCNAPRRPDCNNLLDVFINIRDDENEHVKTMAACQSDEISRALAQKDECEPKW